MKISKKVENILKTNYIADADSYKKYRENLISNRNSKAREKKMGGVDLFSIMGADPTDNSDEDKKSIKTKKDLIKWATNDYSELGDGFGFNDPVSDISIIVPRSQKAKEAQKKRVKDKAEVFTPSWVCNKMNNLVDNETVYPNAFNIENDDKTWTPTESPVKFDGKEWLDYIKSTRLEMTMGEAPYICSLYDTVSGNPIPVRDSEGRFQRIGLLDRKLRVVSENVDKDGWIEFALLALANTFGYEWQGDNLYLARVNILQTFVDYYEDVFDELPSDALIEKVAEIISWNFWQMDGLKMVVPETCKSGCKACKDKKFAGHDSDFVSVVRFNDGDSIGNFNIYSFEELFPVENWG